MPFAKDISGIERYPEPSVEEEDLFNRGSTINQDGGAWRDRTADLVLAKDALSQLS